jgi:hypothetical protein
MGAFQMYILHYWALQYLFYAQTTKSVTSPPAAVSLGGRGLKQLAAVIVSLGPSAMLYVPVLFVVHPCAWGSSGYATSFVLRCP